jgi:hypothetical protein
MNDANTQPEPRADVIYALRHLAAGGATVRPLVQEICARLGHKKPLVLPVVWYFTKAFCLPLPEALPLREWLGSEDDTEINAQILPAIERTRDRWMAELAAGYNGSTGTGVAEPGAGEREHRS